MTGALGLEGGLARQTSEPTGQSVLQGDALTACLIECLGKSCLAALDMDAHLGGSGKGIALDVVDGQNIVREPIAPPGVFVSGVASPVNSGEQIL